MLRLYLLRHGKSDWQAPFEEDHDRPLAPRGRRAAELIGRFLQRLDEAPGLVLSSTALRARTTAELAARAAGWEAPLELSPRLYEATPQAVLETLHARAQDTAPLLVVGHEPTISALAALVTGGGRLRMPTAALASIRFDGAAWSEVAAGTGTLDWLVTPKLLSRAGFA